MDHPDLQEIGSPVTKKCMSAYLQKCRKRKIDENTEITANQLNDLDKINGNKTQVSAKYADFQTWMYQSFWSKTTLGLKLICLS